MAAWEEARTTDGFERRLGLDEEGLRWLGDRGEGTNGVAVGGEAEGRGELGERGLHLPATGAEER